MIKHTLALTALAGALLATASQAVAASSGAAATTGGHAASHGVGSARMPLGAKAPTEGARLYAHPATPGQLARQRHEALATRAGAPTSATAASTSTNWSGLAATGSYQGVAGEWVVPTVQATTTNKYSCTWIGLDGWTNQSLIQTGTEEDAVNGRTVYYAWMELIPASQQRIYYTNGALVPVAPGDTMWSYIYRTGTNVWAIYLQDLTRGWTFSKSVSYASPGANVEWVHEATQVNGVVGHPPVFNPVTFTYLEVMQAGTWYYTGLTANNEIFLVQGGYRYASPSAPAGTNPQHFSITYG